MPLDKYITYNKVIYANTDRIDELLETSECEGVRYCLLLANSTEYPFISDYFDLLRCFRVAQSFPQVAIITVSCGSWEKVFVVKDSMWHNFSEKLLPGHPVNMPIKISCTKNLEIIGVKLCERYSNHNNIDLEEYGFRESFEPYY